MIDITIYKILQSSENMFDLANNKIFFYFYIYDLLKKIQMEINDIRKKIDELCIEVFKVDMHFSFDKEECYFEGNIDYFKEDGDCFEGSDE